MWKLIYGLTIVKAIEEDPFEGINNGKGEEEKEEETEKEKEDTNVEEIQKEKDEIIIVEKQ